MKITTKQIKNIIFEELNKFLREEMITGDLKSVVSPQITDKAVSEYNSEIEKDIKTILKSNIENIPPEHSESLTSLMTGDPNSALNLLRGIYPELEKTDEEKEADAEAFEKIDQWQELEENEYKDYLADTRIENKDLSNLVFKNYDFGNIDLSSTNMTGVVFRKCDLSATTGLQSSSLAGASCDSETKWPQGFDPVNAGVKIISLDKSIYDAIEPPYTDEQKKIWKEFAIPYQAGFTDGGKAMRAYYKKTDDETLLIVWKIASRYPGTYLLNELYRRGYEKEELYCIKGWERYC